MIFLEISSILSSNVFITCMHICDMRHSDFLFDTILRFDLLIFKCLCLCFYWDPYKHLCTCSLFLFLFLSVLYQTGSTGTFDIGFFTVDNFYLMFYFIEIKQYLVTCEVAVILVIQVVSKLFIFPNFLYKFWYNTSTLYMKKGPKILNNC